MSDCQRDRLAAETSEHREMRDLVLHRQLFEETTALLKFHAHLTAKNYVYYQVIYTFKGYGIIAMCYRVVIVYSTDTSFYVYCIK